MQSKLEAAGRYLQLGFELCNGTLRNCCTGLCEKKCWLHCAGILLKARLHSSGRHALHCCLIFFAAGPWGKPSRFAILVTSICNTWRFLQDGRWGLTPYQDMYKLHFEFQTEIGTNKVWLENQLVWNRNFWYFVQAICEGTFLAPVLQEESTSLVPNPQGTCILPKEWSWKEG